MLTFSATTQIHFIDIFTGSDIEFLLLEAERGTLASGPLRGSSSRGTSNVAA
jgi:hypothetical protein